MIIREFLCSDCGARFESSESPQDVVCPNCDAEDPQRAFFTPPGIKSPQTQSKDESLKALAADYGLSNMSNRDGSAVKKAPTGPTAPQFATGNPQALQMLAKLGSNSDSFSPVLPQLQAAGRPHQWARFREKR